MHDSGHLWQPLRIYHLHLIRYKLRKALSSRFEGHMRVYLTKPELATDAGSQLLDLCRRVTEDGRIDLEEIKGLRRWLREHQDEPAVAAVPYLHDIMTRITADRVIDRDELVELHLAVERVIPVALRTPAIQARKKREQLRRDRRRAQRKAEQDREREERQRERAAEYARAMRLRHSFGKVVGVTFPNDDGSERQDIVASCRAGEQLYLRHDEDNEYSMVATQVLRRNGEQLGHAPEYLAEKIVENMEDGYNVFCILTDVTGGTFDKPTYGANIAVFFAAKDVSEQELNDYVNEVLSTRG